MKRWVFLAACIFPASLASLAACSGSSSDASNADPVAQGGDEAGRETPDGSAADGGADATDAAPRCTAVAFAAEPQSFALPSSFPFAAQYVPFSALGGSNVQVNGGDYENHTTIDVDGDGKLDLVLTYRTSLPAVGRTEWLVYKGDGTKFAATPMSFKLPSSFPFAAQYVPFSALGGSNVQVNGGDYENHTTIDIDGDGKLDLVLTYRTSLATVGRTEWLVYKGDGTKFAATPMSFKLPSSFPFAAQFVPFSALGGSNVQVNGGDYENHTTIDVDGDGKLDLVLTYRTSLAAVGRTEWLVYKGDGTKFSATPTSFKLPSSFPFAAQFVPFSALGGSNVQVNGGDYENHTTIDVDGDGKLDLVLTYRTSLPAVGRTEWLVYKGDGTKFAATPTSFKLPSSFPFAAQFVPFSALGGSNVQVNGGDYENHTTIDVDGDGKLDLVLTYRTSLPAVGRTEWLVYKGDGTKFAATPMSFKLPSSFPFAAQYVPFSALGGSNVQVNGGDYENHTTVDVDGDGKLDLVLTYRTSLAAVGRTEWLVYKGTCP